MVSAAGEFSPNHVLTPVVDKDATQHELSGELASALVRTGQLNGRNLRFEVREEAIVMHGVVRTYYQKQIAQEALRPLLGSRRLANLLQVAR